MSPKQIMYKNRFFLLALAASLISLLAYSQFFGIQYMEFDAVSHILSYTSTNPSTAIAIFTQSQDHYLITGQQYRPVQSLAWWLLLLAFGFNFHAFHALNFLLHATNAFLVFFLAKKLLKDRRGFFSLLAAFLFALHPIHLNTVPFVSRLPELLVGFSLLSSLLLLIKFLEQRRRLFFYLSFLFCAVGIFSKEAGSLIPIALFSYVFLYSAKGQIKHRLIYSLRTCWPFFALIVSFILLMLFSLNGIAGTAHPGAAPYQLLGFLLQWLLYPIEFTGFLPASAAREAFAAAFILALALLAAALALRRFPRCVFSEELGFPIALLSLFLFSYLLTGFFAPWYLYLPSMALGLLVAGTIRLVWQSKKKNAWRLVAFLFAALLVFPLIACSPLFNPYPQVDAAARLTMPVLNQTLAETEALPGNSKIYLVNYPAYLKYRANGFRSSFLLVNEASVQAFLDFRLPERRFNVSSLSGLILLRPGEELESEYNFVKNCVFIAENNRQAAAIHLPMPYLLDSNGLEGITLKPFYKKDKASIEIRFKGESTGNEFLLFFNGSRVEAIPVSGFCRRQA